MVKATKQKAKHSTKFNSLLLPLAIKIAKRS